MHIFKTLNKKLILTISSLTLLLCMIMSSTVFAEATTAQAKSPLVISPYSWIMYLVNFLILYLALRFFLWKPINKFLDERTASIRLEIDQAEQKNIDATKLKTQYSQLLEDGKHEKQKIINQALHEARKQHDAIMTLAYQDSESYRRKIREDLDREHDLMLKKLNTEITNLSILAASAIVEKNMDEKSNRELVQSIISSEVDDK